MKLKYLGTAAAEGYPAMFCNCENCKKAFARGGKNIRSRSQAIVDDNLLLDFPCDTYLHALHYGINLHDIRHLLITHVHRDHLYPVDLIYFKPGFTHPAEDYMLTVYGSEDVANTIWGVLPESVKKHLTVQTVEPFKPFTVGKYTVTALKAYHGTDNPYIYAISDGQKTMLYAHDTDIFREETWEYMKSAGLHFDLVTMDCTEGAEEDLSYHGHMCLGRNIACKQRLLDENLIDEKTVVVLNHFSHNGKASNYEDFEPIAKENGFETSFDGMEIAF
ncbi:MAG: hypothetical protein IIX54_00240 [Clostridia bacterium]|nr:hypothetical protein [Clostridia bacterium]